MLAASMQPPLCNAGFDRDAKSKTIKSHLLQQTSTLTHSKGDNQTVNLSPIHGKSTKLDALKADAMEKHLLDRSTTHRESTNCKTIFKSLPEDK